MKYWVIYNNQLSSHERDEYAPSNWIMYLHLVKDNYSPAGFDVLTLEQVKEHQNFLWEEYQSLQQEKSIWLSTNKLRVTDLIHHDFLKTDISKIDFTKHLKEGVFLEKRDVSMKKNGRPEKATYYLGETPIAEICFEFEVDYLNFMTRRIEKLGYYTVGGEINKYFVISDESFSGSIPYQHSKRLAERVTSRQNIINSLSADIDRMLTIAVQQNPTQSSALSSMINSFWVEYNPHLSAFIAAGGTYLRTKFQNDSTYSFLNSFVAPSVTVRMYIIDKLTY